MSVFSHDNQADPQNMQYMSEVDAALHMQGHPYAFVLTLSVFAFFGTFFLWASIATMDDVTRGMGQVIPAAGINPVQSERGGTITKILVKENEVVEEGQLLVTISNIVEVATLRDLQNKNIELALSIIRLEAEANGKELVFMPSIEERYPEAVSAQKHLYEARKEQYLGEDEQLEAQSQQRREEVEEAIKKQQETEISLAILNQQEKKLRPLVGGSVTQIEYLEMQQNIVLKEGERSNIKQAILRAQSGVNASEQNMKNRVAERMSAIAEELNKNRIEQDTIQERVKVSGEMVTNTEMRAPIAGTVKQILLKEDSIAKPAETILEIIPNTGTLEIEAKFHPQDRGFLYVEQGGMVKFSAYDFSIYGGLEATITRISEDTIDDKKGVPWYEVRMVTKNPTLMYKGRELEIHPGMTITVDILTETRSVLDFIMRPIRRAMSNAMTER